MKIEVAVKKASSMDYAYLVDRVAINSGRQQVYGTQMTLNSDSSSYTPKPLIDPTLVDERRKEMGLGPIENYIKIMNERYFGTLKK